MIEIQIGELEFFVIKSHSARVMKSMIINKAKNTSLIAMATTDTISSKTYFLLINSNNIKTSINLSSVKKLF